MTLPDSNRASDDAARCREPDDIVARALQLIKPKPEWTEKAREEVIEAIGEILFADDSTPGRADAAHVKRIRRKNRKIANVLQAAIEVLERPDVVSLRFLVRDVDGKAEAKDRLHILREELAALQAVAAEFADAPSGGRKGQKENFKKLAAAAVAHDLLHSHGIKPTLSAESNFFRLAATLYEGATGIAGEDLTRACRRVFHRY